MGVDQRVAVRCCNRYILHLRCGKCDALPRHPNPDTRKFRICPLQQGCSIGAHWHPAPVMGQAVQFHSGFCEIDGGCALDGIDMNAFNVHGLILSKILRNCQRQPAMNKVHT